MTEIIEEEIWKPVEGYENYQVSSHGRFKYWFCQEPRIPPTIQGNILFTVCKNDTYKNC